MNGSLNKPDFGKKRPFSQFRKDMFVLCTAACRTPNFIIAAQIPYAYLQLAVKETCN